MAILVDWQASKVVRPAFCLSDCLGIDFLTVSQQINCDRSWTFAILVIAIFPSLASRHSRCLWSVRIGDVVTLYLTSITWNSFLTYGISDFLACRILRQSLGLILPFVSGSHILLINNRIAIQNLNLNRSWTLTILVVRIFPFLLTRNLNRFWSVRVSDVVTVHLARVA